MPEAGSKCFQALPERFCIRILAQCGVSRFQNMLPLSCIQRGKAGMQTFKMPGGGKVVQLWHVSQQINLRVVNALSRKLAAQHTGEKLHKERHQHVEVGYMAHNRAQPIDLGQQRGRLKLACAIRVEAAERCRDPVEKARV